MIREMEYEAKQEADKKKQGRLSQLQSKDVQQITSQKPLLL